MLRPTRTPETMADRVHRPSRRRNDRGLTTLEWLLIVAAVAGLAALAVVLVQNVVDDTAEQISEGSARLTAAEVAAAEITDDATEVVADGMALTEAQKSTLEDLEQKCERLKITYGAVFDSADSEQTAKWTNHVDAVTDTPAKCEIADDADA